MPASRTDAKWMSAYPADGHFIENGSRNIRIREEINNGLEYAIEFATRAHAGQKDKSGKPYIFHPLRSDRRLGNVSVFGLSRLKGKGKGW